MEDEINSSKTYLEIEMQEFLDSVFDTNGGYHDVASKKLIEFYDLKNSNNENNIVDEIKKLYSFKLSENIQNVVVEKQKEKIEEDISEEFDGNEIDENTKKLAMKKAQKTSSEEDYKTEVMKRLYLDMYKDYEHELIETKKNQLKKGSATVGDKEGTKLVLFEKALLNFDDNYKNYANRNGLSLKKINDDSEVKEEKDKLENELNKYNHANDNKVEENISEIKKLIEKRNEISENINTLVNSDSVNPEQFEFSMNEYQREYYELTLELELLDPSLVEIKKQIDLNKTNQKFHSGKIGNNSNPNEVPSDYGEKYKSEKNEKRKNTVTETENNDQKNKSDTLESIIKEIKEEINSNHCDYDKIKQLFEQAETIVGNDFIDYSFMEMSDDEQSEKIENLEQNDSIDDSTESFAKQFECGIANSRQEMVNGQLNKLEKELSKINTGKRKKEDYIQVEKTHVLNKGKG